MHTLQYCGTAVLRCPLACQTPSYAGSQSTRGPVQPQRGPALHRSPAYPPVMSACREFIFMKGQEAQPPSREQPSPPAGPGTTDSPVGSSTCSSTAGSRETGRAGRSSHGRGQLQPRSALPGSVLQPFAHVHCAALRCAALRCTASHMQHCPASVYCHAPVPPPPACQL